MTNWYDKYIEEGIRKEVRLLRDNGFNTICSCEHEMYIQCLYTTDARIQDLDRLLFDNGYRDYTIHIYVERVDGHLNSLLQVDFRKVAP